MDKTSVAKEYSIAGSSFAVIQTWFFKLAGGATEWWFYGILCFDIPFKRCTITIESDNTCMGDFLKNVSTLFVPGAGNITSWWLSFGLNTAPVILKVRRPGLSLQFWEPNFFCVEIVWIGYMNFSLNCKVVHSGQTYPYRIVVISYRIHTLRIDRTLKRLNTNVLSPVALESLLHSFLSTIQ